MQMRMFVALTIPWPDPIGLPAGMTLAAPSDFNRRATTGSSLV